MYWPINILKFITEVHVLTCTHIKNFQSKNDESYNPGPRPPRVQSDHIPSGATRKAAVPKTLKPRAVKKIVRPQAMVRDDPLEKALLASMEDAYSMSEEEQLAQAMSMSLAMNVDGSVEAEPSYEVRDRPLSKINTFVLTPSFTTGSFRTGRR